MPTEKRASSTAKGSIAVKLDAPYRVSRGFEKTLHAYAVPSMRFMTKPTAR